MTSLHVINQCRSLSRANNNGISHGGKIDNMQTKIKASDVLRAILYNKQRFEVSESKGIGYVIDQIRLGIKKKTS